MHGPQYLFPMSSSSVHGRLVFTWKMIFGTRLEYFEKYSVSDPLMQTHATCSLDRALAHLGVTSNLEQIGCVVLLYTWPARASVNPPGARLDPLIKLICNDVWKLAEPHSVMNYSNFIVCLIIIGLMYGAQLWVWTIYWAAFLEASCSARVFKQKKEKKKK